jgi:hypothetical protein
VFVYDGNQIVMQFQKTSATGSASALTASDLSDRYLWGPAVDQLLADDQLQGATPQVVWTLGDNENTIRDLATYSGGVTAIMNHRVFSAYGELLSQTDPSATPISPAAVDCLFDYTGRPEDTATGLQFNGGAGQVGRWYDAITGRWLSEDHI